MDDRRRLDLDQRGTRSSTQARSRPRTTDAPRGMSDPPSRPRQRPSQFQHGRHDNAFGDAESTEATPARLAAARDPEDRPARPAWQCPPSRTPVGVRFEATADRDAAVAYLDLLDHVVADRGITAAEVRRLRQFATDWGIGALEAARLHRDYVARTWARACPGTRTEAERCPMLRLPPRASRDCGWRSWPWRRRSDIVCVAVRMRRGTVACAAR
jgi:hypothetical protein